MVVAPTRSPHNDLGARELMTPGAWERSDSLPLLAPKTARSRPNNRASGRLRGSARVSTLVIVLWLRGGTDRAYRKEQPHPAASASPRTRIAHSKSWPRGRVRRRLPREFRASPQDRAIGSWHREGISAQALAMGALVDSEAARRTTGTACRGSFLAWFAGRLSALISPLAKV